MEKNLNIKNKFLLFNIQKNYKFLSNYLASLQIHINFLYKNNILSPHQRNIALGKIYENIKYLNADYNNYIINKIDSNIIILSKYLDIDIIDNNKNFNLIRKYLQDIYILDFNYELNELLYPLDVKRNTILKLSQEYGCLNINFILEIIEKVKLTNYYDKTTMIFLNFLNNIFIPLNFKVNNKIFKNNNFNINYNEYLTNEDIKNYETDNIINNFYENFNIYYSKNNNDEMLNKIVTIEIKFLDKYIEINGFFLKDSINIYIKSCQISNKFIYLKKKILENKLKDSKGTKNFCKNFFKTLTIGDILIFNEDNFIKDINKYYDKYIDLISKSFMNIMKDFIKKNNKITDMYNTIRLLLLGNEENINIASLLFEITKDKKINSNLIYNLIYDNLNYISQIKLKKSISSMKEEFKHIQSMSLVDVDFKKQILALKNMPLNIKSLALEKVEEMNNSNNEYYKQLLYVKTLIKFPWPSPTDNLLYDDLNINFSKRKKYISNIENDLKKLTYGHDKAKNALVQTIAKWISKTDSNGNVISFVGPPGVGKTLLARSIGDVLNIPFAQITLGGQNDGELLHGHGYTYSGSQPGIIVKKMIDMGKSKCILYFDELDKACSKHGSNEISSILIHLTDPNMNKTFQDRFFQGVDFPLNKVIMIFSYNDRKKIDPILLDRFQEIKIKPYSVKDKVKIFYNFMLKELCENIGFNKTLFNFTEDDIKFIINEYTMEAGVREFKRKVESILLNLNVDRLYQRNLFKKKSKKINITRDIIIKILNKPEAVIEKIHSEPKIGIINGLYATSIGSGGIVPIQIYNNFYNNESPFSLRLTGCQGDVMKESVQCSLTCAIDYISNNLEKYKIKDLKKHITEKWKSGFHVHVPNGATPKDGPSAGCAFTTAFISRLLEKKIDNEIAMTGEIDLLGNVTKIGGLEYKINGAVKAGVKKICISVENKDDYEKIKSSDPELFNNLEIILVSNINDIVNNVF